MVLKISVLICFAAVWRSNREQSEKRISRVLDAYRANARSHTAMALDGLIKAGVRTLKNDREIRTLIARITTRGEDTTLHKCETLLQNVDLQTFFESAKEHGDDFINKGTPEDVIRRMKDHEKDT